MRTLREADTGCDKLGAIICVENILKKCLKIINMCYYIYTKNESSKRRKEMIRRTKEEHNRLVEHLDLVSKAIRNKLTSMTEGILIVEVANSRIMRINDDQVSLKEQHKRKIPVDQLDDIIEEIQYYLWKCLVNHVRFNLKIVLEEGSIKDVQKSGFNKPEELVG